MRDAKVELRREALRRRERQADKDELSRVILDRLAGLLAFVAARTVMLYVDVRSEVRTRPFLPDVLRQGKRLVVPFCRDGELGLFRLLSMQELETGRFGILEPRPELRQLPDCQVELAEIDLIVVPGVAFDRAGGRLGHGFGYYDKLLQRARPGTTLVGLAFECQLFPQIPVEPHDVRLDRVVTEAAVY